MDVWFLSQLGLVSKDDDSAPCKEGREGDIWLQGKKPFKTSFLDSFSGRSSSCPLERQGMGRGETLGARLVLKIN